MATTVRNASLGKEKSRSQPSTPQNIDPPHVRRTSKTSSSPDKAFSFLSEKSAPHYLRPTISSTKDVSKYGKKQASDDSILKQTHNRRKSFEKPPSPSQLQRTLSSSPRVRTLKPSSPPTKKASSSKPIFEKASKTPRIVKSQPVITRPGNIKKSTSITPKKETKATTSRTTTTPTSLDVIETQRTKLEQEDELILVQDDEQDKIKFIDEEEIELEVPSLLDERPIDFKEIEPNNSLDENPNTNDSSTLSAEQVLAPAPHIEEVEKIINEHPENDINHDDQVTNTTTNNNNNEDCSKQGEEGQLKDEEEVKVEEGEERKIEKPTPIDDSNDKNSPHKLNFRTGKELEEKEDEDEGRQRLQFKEREEDVGEIDDGKGEPENVVLKKQDVQGKKESQAYNDVIEETASKLVEKRKSKVKALVGAFETVISLQENEGQQAEGIHTP